MRNKIIIGNWKMYKNHHETEKFLEDFNKITQNSNIKPEYGIAANFINLATIQNRKIKKLIITAQNCHYETEGAFTGEISIKMLQDVGVTHVIIGHSERRMYFNETNETINQKLKALFKNNMTPILCCGETLSEYENKKTENVIKNQIELALKDIPEAQVAKIVIAYEPIWAIGTGKTASANIAQDVCSMIRKFIEKLYNKDVAQAVRIQYGGSVKPDNITELLEKQDIDGALVGGASLEPESFSKLLI